MPSKPKQTLTINNQRAANQLRDCSSENESDGLTTRSANGMGNGVGKFREMPIGLWSTKHFDSFRQQRKWVDANRHQLNIVEIFVNNGYAVQFKKLIQL